MPAAANLPLSSQLPDPPGRIQTASENALGDNTLRQQPGTLPTLNLHALRWPLAWVLACLITLLMLTALAFESVRPPRPTTHQLAAVLVPKAAAEPLKSPTPKPDSPAIAKVAPPAANTAQGVPPRTMPDTPPVSLTASADKASEVTVASASPRATNDSPVQTSTTSPVAQASTNETTRTLAKTSTALPAVDDLATRCPVQVEPSFPRAAQEDDITRGRVIARLQIDASGKIDSVDILSAEPPGYFEREVRRAALKWHCQPSGHAESLRVPFHFRLN